jgi:glycosyltransferase involved in cell wall biosynthesis
MPALSVVIITFNEERNIGRCLESVKDIADDIVVVDSFSTDRTEEICRQYPVNFVQKKWPGYSEQKNYANSLAKHDWIFSIDADEAVSPELQNSILEAKRYPEILFYRICRMTNYCGKWVHHGGWYPDIKVRFFNRRVARWEGLIHEKLSHAYDRDVPLLKGDCYHYSYYTIAGHRAQSRKFADLAAAELYAKEKKAGLFKLYASTLHRFMRGYFLELGFLDGYAGWMIAWISAHACYMKYSKLRQLHAERKV